MTDANDIRTRRGRLETVESPAADLRTEAVDFDEHSATEWHGREASRARPRPSPSPSPSSEIPHPRIGSYRLVRPLGSGGMGVVHLAEQERPVHRQVALKLIRVGALDLDMRRRFEAEREALARLSHPNVARLYEAGATAAGELWFAMELVDGQRITDYCDENRLGLEARLRLFVEVCAGVEHAHRRGILHRDLKPSNILVRESDRGPVVKIIDFGIAKALDQPLLDVTLETGNRVLGSPGYLAPEAVGTASGLDPLDLDTRCDVYSLGVVLHELLVGERAFADDHESVMRHLRRVLHEDPAGPLRRWQSFDPVRRDAVAEDRGLAAQALTRRLRRDLDTIVRTALARDRDDRYGSPRELADDLERHLDDLPISVGQASAWTRTVKFVRRRRGWVAAGLLLVASLAGGIVARTVEAERANREALAARLALAESEEVTSFLTDLFEVSDPDRSKGEAVLARDLLDEGARGIGDRFEGQPLLRARLLRTIGSVYENLGLYTESETQLRQALDLDRRRDPTGTEVAEDQLRLGSVALAVGRLPEAEARLRLARSLVEPTEPDGDLAGRIAARLGIAATEAGRLEEATEHFRRSLEIHVRRGADDATLSGVWNALGANASELGDDRKALEHFEVALRLRLAASGEESSVTAMILNNVGLSRWAVGDQDGALEAYGRALSIREKLQGPDHPDLVSLLNNLGVLHRTRKEENAAQESFLRAAGIVESALGPEHPNLASLLANLATGHRLRGEVEEALALDRRALAIRTAAFGERNPTTAQSMHGLASSLTDAGDFGAAESLFRKCSAVLDEALPDGHPARAYPLLGLGKMYRKAGRPSEAEAEYRRVLAIRVAALPEDSPELVEIRTTFAGFLRELGRDAEAEEVEAGVANPVPASVAP